MIDLVHTVHLQCRRAVIWIKKNNQRIINLLAMTLLFEIREKLPVLGKHAQWCIAQNIDCNHMYDGRYGGKFDFLLKILYVYIVIYLIELSYTFVLICNIPCRNFSLKSYSKYKNKMYLVLNK